MAMTVEGAVFTHRGRRIRNEDNGRITRLGSEHVVAIVCDGMGGHLAGDHASAVVATELSQALLDGTEPVEAIETINRHLFREAQADASKNGMGTTLVAAIIKGRQFTFLNVGDSRGYLLHANGRLEQITRDHSYVEEAIAAGELTRETAATSTYKNALTRAMGTDPTVRVDVFGPFDLPIGGTLFLCTDGIYKVLADSQLADLLKAKPEERISALAVKAFEAGSDDNTTAAVLWIDDGTGTRTNPKGRAKAAEKATVTLDKLAALADREREQRRKNGSPPPSTANTRRKSRMVGVLFSLVGISLMTAPLWSWLSVNPGDKLPTAEVQEKAAKITPSMSDPVGRPIAGQELDSGGPESDRNRIRATGSLAPSKASSVADSLNGDSRTNAPEMNPVPGSTTPNEPNPKSVKEAAATPSGTGSTTAGDLSQPSAGACNALSMKATKNRLNMNENCVEPSAARSSPKPPRPPK